MIKSTGIFFENDYLKHSRELDGVEPQNMAKTAAIVLALDTAKRPIARVLDAETAEVASTAQVKAFQKLFKDIDQKDPAPMPLQVYDGEIAAARTAHNLLAAGVGQVTILAKSAVYDELCKAVGDANVSVAEFDEEVAREIDGQSYGTQIELLTRGQILQAARVAGVTARRSEFDSLLITHADLVDFEPRHYRKMRASFEENPSIDFATAYAEWLHGAPTLFSRRFLNGFAKPIDPAPRNAQGAAFMACRTYDARTVIMGEEKLFGPYPVPAQVLKEGALPKSALATVQAARNKPTHDEKQKARAAGQKPDKHVKAAANLLSEIDASLKDRPIDDLDWADAWARRNRMDFPIFATRDNAGLVYLDAAATSLTPSCVIATGVEYEAHYDANIWRGVYPNSVHSTMRYQAAREKVANFIGADPRDVIFTANTTTSMNLIADAWARFSLKKGDTVCVMLNEHHSNLLPWIKAADETGAEVEIIPIGLSGRIDWSAYEKLLAKRPKMVAAAHVSNVIGLENPIKRMAHAAHEAGAVFALDAAQSSPHLALDVRKLEVDFLAFSGHKLHAPTGVGVLWAHPDRIREMRPVQVGGGTISEVSLQGTYWRQAPYCFEQGTPPIEQAIALGAAVDYLQTIGMDNVERHVRALTKYALRVAGIVGGMRIWGDHGSRDGEMGLMSYAADHLSGLQTSILLGKMGVATRAGAHCAVQLALALGIPGSTRISFGPYTTKADIDAWGYAMKVIGDLSEGEVSRI